MGACLERYQEQYQAALEDYNRVIELDPGFTDAYLGRAHAYLNLQDRGNAVPEFYQWIVLNATDTQDAALTAMPSEEPSAASPLALMIAPQLDRPSQ